MRRTVLLLGHGSRDPDGKREFAELVGQVRAALPGTAIEAGVLEFADAAVPSADEAIDRCVAQGATRVQVVPALLHGAMHSRTDVPDLLHRAARRHPGVDLLLAPPLTSEEALLAVLEERVRAAEAQWPGPPSPDSAVLLVARGSHHAAANADMFRTGRLFAERRGGSLVECCFVSLTRPDVPAGLERCIRLGARRVIVAPYFLHTGVLVKRIAAQVATAQEQHPGVEIVVADHLGIHPRIIELVCVRAVADARAIGSDRNNGTRAETPGGPERSVASPAPGSDELPWAMGPDRFPLLRRYGLGPAASEELSLRRVEAALRGHGSWRGHGAEVVRRMVYAAGDPSLASAIRIHPAAVEAGIAALRAGQPIITDVRMVTVALDRARLDRLATPVRCAIEAPAAARARQHGVTRAAAGMAAVADGLSGGIAVIGNAPTALLALLDLVDAGRAQPAVIIGAPVGFVAAAEAKAELATRATPHITVLGTRGGSAVAAAALNALLRLAAAEGGT